MPPAFLKEKDKKEIKENVQISTSSFLNKTNLRVRLHETRSELKPVWDFTSG